MNADLQYHNALVTGASSGLGAALCRELVWAGCTVWGTSRDAGRIDVPGVIPVSVDLAHAASISAFVKEMQMELGQIDLLVNCAGYGVFGNIEDADPEDIHDQVELMLTAPALLCQAVLPGMKARAHGCIANVSSLAVRFPLPGMALYNASKAGLSNFSQCLAQETSANGICVIDFQPGDFRSGFLEATRNMGAGDAAWTAMEKHMLAAPDSTVIAQDLVRVINAGRGGTFCSGSFFQASLAPLAHRLLPQRVMSLLQHMYMKS